MYWFFVRIDKVERSGVLIVRLDKVNHGKVQVLLRLPRLNKAVHGLLVLLFPRLDRADHGVLVLFLLLYT